MTTKPEKQLEVLVAGTSRVLSPEELLAKLRENRPLRVKLGFDPSAPDIHLGHTVVLSKIRQFQDFGHQAVIIIGDYTARIGDPTGRSKTRPPLSPEEIAVNARTYQDQIFKILDPARTEVRYNSQWLGKMTYADVLRLNAKMNVARMLERDDFKKRFDEGVAITLTEFQYPLMQGYDSVEVRADVELGGNDQLFNNLVGRDLQRDAGQPPQVVMVMPILEGLDGVQKMSKSLGNAIFLSDDPKTVEKKVRGMYTDPKRIRADIPGTVEGNPVFIYHDIFNPNREEVEDLKTRYRQGRVGDVEVKEKLARALNNFLDPIRERREQFAKERGLVEEIIYTGTLKVRQIADETLEAMKQAMGLRGIWKNIERKARERMKE